MFPKKEILMACICDLKIILESYFLFWKLPKRESVSKKGSFDGWYKWSKNLFGVKFPFLVVAKKGNTFQKKKF